MGVYKENNIYKNKELLDFIETLEDKYPISNYSEKYYDLVNFSKNGDVPFHQWFRYREGFAGELIEKLIKDSGIREHSIVIDPFAGSGTTPVVAKNLGYESFAVDINPISSFITNIKLRDYTENELDLIKKEIEKYQNDKLINIEKCKIELESIDSLKRYFTENNFYEIAQIKKYITYIQSETVKDFLKCGLLCIIENVSNRRRDGNGLKGSKTKITNVKEYFLEKLNEMIVDIGENIDGKKGKGLCLYGTAEKLSYLYEKNVESKNRDKVIIFSPPYPNSFDYFESYKLELVVGDFADNIRDIKKYRKNAIRSFIGVEKQGAFDKYVELLAEEIELAIPIKEAKTGKKDSRTRKVPNMIMGYFYDMEEVIKQCYETLDKGNKVYIVIGQSSYLGIIIPSDLLFAYFAEGIGFKVNEIVECRKARTSPQQLRRFPYLKNTLRESILILEK